MKNKNNESEMKSFIGIDVSKATLDISFDHNHQKIDNTTEAIHSFIVTYILGKPIKLCVVESTGGYEQLVMRLLQQHGVPVHRAHPNRVYAFAKACNHFAKTDKLDSLLLQKYASFVGEKELGDLALSEAQQQLQELRSVVRHLDEQVHANQCRLHHLSGKAKDYVEQQIPFARDQLLGLHKEIENLIKTDNHLSRKSDLLMTYKGVGEKQLVYCYLSFQS